jgi:hypothetical protein
MTLNTPTAIIVGAALLALTGLFLFRYEIIVEGQTALRLNRITGSLIVCSPTDCRPD